MSTFIEAPAARTDWETPQWLFDALDAEFNFTVDVCANAVNRKCGTYFSPETNGLAQNWGTGRCWMNPPYGDEIEAWIHKAYSSALSGALVVALIPVRSSNEWWKWVIEGEVRFIRKKIQFVGAPFNSMFPNAIVVFRPQLTGGGVMKIWNKTKPAK